MEKYFELMNEMETTIASKRGLKQEYLARKYTGKRGILEIGNRQYRGVFTEDNRGHIKFARDGFTNESHVHIGQQVWVPNNRRYNDGVKETLVPYIVIESQS